MRAARILAALFFPPKVRGGRLPPEKAQQYSPVALTLLLSMRYT